MQMHYRQQVNKSQPAWSRLVEREPILSDLLDQVASMDVPNRERQPSSFWRLWTNVKNDLCRLVGDDADRAELRTSDDYDAAYEFLFAHFAARGCR